MDDLSKETKIFNFAPEHFCTIDVKLSYRNVSFRVPVYKIVNYKDDSIFHEDRLLI